MPDQPITNPLDTHFTDKPICPHCGFRHEDAWDMSDGENDCWHCGKAFHLDRRVEVTYSTITIEPKNKAK